MKVQIYRDRKNEWRSRFTSPNGRILFVSSEGYKRKRGAVTAFITLADAILHNEMHMIEEK